MNFCKARKVADKALEIFLVFAPLVMLVWILFLIGGIGRSLLGIGGLVAMLCLYMAGARIGVKKSPKSNDAFLVRLKKSVFSYAYVGEPNARQD